jgi:hypothetical protein
VRQLGLKYRLVFQKRKDRGHRNYSCYYTGTLAFLGSFVKIYFGYPLQVLSVLSFTGFMSLASWMSRQQLHGFYLKATKSYKTLKTYLTPIPVLAISTNIIQILTAGELAL